MKNRLTILVGISGSGKSTWAHEQWEKDPTGVIIVNRDNIRQLLYGYTEKTIKDYYNNNKLFALEREVTRYEDTLIHEALAAGKDVIVDSTHLTIEYLERFRYWNVTTEIRTFIIEPLEAIKRDMKRTRQVGDEVIKKQYEKFKKLLNNKKTINFEPVSISCNESLPDCVIFDIDGTLAHMGDRNPFDWKRVGEDTVDKSTAAIASYVWDTKTNPTVIICTGRDSTSGYMTQKWLGENEIDYDWFHIRREKDMRPDWVVKEEMWRDIATKYNIVGMFDDRLQVVRRARALGLKVFHVEYNNV